MESIKKLISSKDDLIKDFVERRKYVSREYQDFGLRIASKLEDTARSSLYIKLAKEKPRALIMQAFSFAVDYPNAKNRGKLFMWKLKELENERKEAGKTDDIVTKQDQSASKPRKKGTRKKNKGNKAKISNEGKSAQKEPDAISKKSRSVKVKRSPNDDPDKGERTQKNEEKKRNRIKRRTTLNKKDGILESEQIRFT